MSKLDRFVSVTYNRSISSFSDVDYDTVVILSSTKVGEDGRVDDKTRSSKPAIFTTASSFPETLGDIGNIGRRCLEHGRRVAFWDEQLKNMYCYLFAEKINLPNVEIELPEEDDGDDDEGGDDITPTSGKKEVEFVKWKRSEGYDQFMLVFPSHLYSTEDPKEDSKKYHQSWFTGDSAGTIFDPTMGSRIVICGNLENELVVSNNVFIAAFVAGIIAGGYRNFTTHLRQIVSVTEDRQLQNPDSNPSQSYYIGSVKLAGNSFIEGSMTRGVVNSEGNTVSRKFIDRQVLEDRLRSRIQEECLRVMTHGNGVPFTESGANLIAGAGGIALAEAAGLNIIDDFDTEVNYGLVTDQHIEARQYKTLVYRFRFAGSIEFVEVVLEV